MARNKPSTKRRRVKDSRYIVQVFVLNAVIEGLLDLDLPVMHDTLRHTVVSLEHTSQRDRSSIFVYAHSTMTVINYKDRQENWLFVGQKHTKTGFYLA